MNWTLIRCVIKAKRNGLLSLIPATQPTRLECLKDKCAVCCRTIGVPLVTKEEAEKISCQWIAEGEKGLFLKSHNCQCCLLKEGLCSIYTNRPSGCREYPWYNIDDHLYYDSGCPGVKHDKDERPNANDIQPFENFFPGTPKSILWLIKLITVRNNQTT